MRTGNCVLLGTFLVLLIDEVWTFSGPIGWGTNGECFLGNTQLSMVTKIIRSKENTISEWSIPESAMVMCANVTDSTDQFKIRVRWSWETEHANPPTTTPPQKASEEPTNKTAADANVTSPDSSTEKTSSKAEPGSSVIPPEVVPSEKAAKSLISEKMVDSMDSCGEFDTSTIERPTTQEPTGASLKPEGTNRVPEDTTRFSASTTDVSTLETGVTDISTSTSDGTTLATGVSASATDISTDDDTWTTDDSSASTKMNSTLLTDVNTSTSDSTTGKLVSGDKILSKGSTIISDAKTLLERKTQRSFPNSLKPTSFLQRSTESPEVFCYPYCDEDISSIRLGGMKNIMILTLTRFKSLFHVSDIFILYALPDEEVFQRVYWKNVNLFPGPVDATHVCENVTRMPLTSQADLILQNVQLAAYLPQEQSEFPESNADCNSKYEEEEVNEFCKTAEIIMITVGAVFIGLLLGGLVFYILQSYFKSKRERDARATLP